jgi:FkbM family methyltransferase
MKQLINQILKNFGYRISRISNSDELHVFQIQKQLIDDLESNITIFDVGACSGQVALKYNSIFPDCKIFCFEPFHESFSKLKQNTSSFENIVAINKGLGQYIGKSKLHSNRSAPTNSILATSKESTKIWGTGLLNTLETIDIELTTLDDFVEINNIKRIDILKLDVQGSEYMVINGAKNSIKQGIIKLVYIEIITLPTYEGQKYLDEILGQLRSHGFDLYNFFNYSLTNTGQLRQVDAIFIKSK